MKLLKTTSPQKVSKKSSKISAHWNLRKLQIIPRGDNNRLGVNKKFSTQLGKNVIS